MATTERRNDGNMIGGGEGGSVLTAAVVADLTGGRLIGDPEAKIRAIAPLDRATVSDLSFLASGKYVEQMAGTSAGVVLVTPDLAETPGKTAARVVVNKPHESLLAVLPRLYPPPVQQPGVHPSVSIGRGATIGRAVQIGPNVVIGDEAVIADGVRLDANVSVGAGARIGESSHIHANASVYPGSVLGRRVVLHSGVRVGSDGFGYVPGRTAHAKIPHIGRCIIEDDVEIGANTTIDRGSIDDTVIGAGTKIDNLVHVAHNVRIGRLCLIAAQVGISGSTRIGDGVVMGGQVGVGGHVTIGSGAQIAGQAGVFGDVPAGETWSGYPARPHKESLRASAALFKLAPLVRRIERLLASKDTPPDITE